MEWRDWREWIGVSGVEWSEWREWSGGSGGSGVRQHSVPSGYPTEWTAAVHTMNKAPESAVGGHVSGVQSTACWC